MLKYVVAVDNYGEESPIVFPATFTHNRIGTLRLAKIVSAGFCMRVDGRWIVSGESESLQVQSRPEDAALLNRYFI